MKIIIEVTEKNLLQALNAVWRGMGKQINLKRKEDIEERDILDLLTKYLDITEENITLK